ncbi:RAD55 family ATPase [Candidatus Uabimicrobium amorphum]|uniref:DNA repair protein RadA n=1 Tax=Uabimicrobium amorphum TaxID=2596890 RepID=A0A5S9IM88_UABAM|nr:DNA/RNA helicase domain-containing protein [Candidatus Uabimicrobium amorphum]BBM84469.1 DNA repair protein RadA [Candidatus Uabimicrobium amorphum]
MSCTVVSNSKYLCVSCQNISEEKSRRCKKCNAIFSIVKIPASVQVSLPKPKTASEIMKRKAIGKPLKGFEFIGSLPKKFSMVIHGEPGSGKSYFALQIADAIANNSKRKTYYVTSEEELENLDFQNKIEYCEPSENLIFESVKNKKEFLKLIRNNSANIIVDSISDLGITAKEIKEFREEIGTFIYILHVTKDGDYRGTTQLIHDPQVQIVVAKGIAKTKKNRFGMSGQEYEIFTKED